VSQSNTIDSCRATCTIIKNEVYGLGDAGVCKFTDASGAMTTTNIPAAVTPAPTTRVQVIVPVANVRSNSSATAVIAGTQSYGAAGSVSNPSTTVDGYTWYLVDFDSGADGWTMNELLESARSSGYASIQNAWDAHLVRNQIAHAGSDFSLSQVEARRVIKMYQNVFEELGII
jgi:hypothetical protein